MAEPTSSKHFLKLCICSQVIAQCRCPSSEKTVQVVAPCIHGQRPAGEFLVDTVEKSIAQLLHRHPIQDSVRAAVVADAAAAVQPTIVLLSATAMWASRELRESLTTMESMASSLRTIAKAVREERVTIEAVAAEIDRVAGVAEEKR